MLLFGRRCVYPVIKGKEAYLKKLTESMYLPSRDVGMQMDGSTPPSVFIGSWNYPKVFAGPMMAEEHGDTAIMDRPESWIPEKKSQEEIIRYRLNLVRGKKSVRVTDLQNRFMEKLRDIALSGSSIESQADFERAPRGMTLSDDHAPFGPSAHLERLEIANSRWDPNLQRAYYDDDQRASDALIDLHRQGLPFSSIEKAFSVGALGRGRSRRMVPTRWAITACDSTLAKGLLERVRGYEPIESFEVREFYALNNRYAVLLLPTAWQFEWMEAFLRIIRDEEMIFSDHESNAGKKGYSRVGGCYYSCKMAVLEALDAERRQAGAIVLREAYSGYVPLGVFNVRESVRNAMKERSKSFDGLRDALQHIESGLQLPMKRFIIEGELLKEQLRSRQTTLSSFS